MNDHQVTHDGLESVGGPVMPVQDGGDNHLGEVIDANFRFEGNCLPATEPPEGGISIAADERLFERERKAWEAGKTVEIVIDVDE